MLMTVLSFTGAIENNHSIAQVNYTAPKVYQVQTEKLYQIASISDTTEKSKEKVEVEEWYIKEIPMEYEQQKFLHSLCERFSYPYELALAQIKYESNFDNTVVGSSGELGMFQILPSWDKYLEQELKRKVNLRDSSDCIESGLLLIYYNTLAQDKYEGREKYVRALNVYNFGSSAYRNYCRNNSYDSWHYGKNIWKIYQEYLKGNYDFEVRK